MASWMIHLRIADELCRRLNIKSRSKFILGNIAPDSGVPSEGGYVPEKSVSNFYAWDGKSHKHIHEELFAGRYLTPELRSGYSAEEDSFYLGYLTHLITDNIWKREIVLPAKQKFEGELRENPNMFWQIIKRDWYDLDFMYLKENPSFPAFAAYRDCGNIKNTYLDFFSETAFEERREFILKFYESGVANLSEHETYISPEELDDFVISAANEIAAQISHYTITPSII